MTNEQASGSKTSKLKTSYKPFRSWEPIHTNGEAAISAGASLLFSTLDQLTIVSDVKTAKKLWTIEGDSSSVTSICCTNTCPTVQSTTFLLIAYRSLSIRIYSLELSNLSDSSLQVELLRTTARAHEAPISVSTSDPTGRLFATGDTAGSVRVWDGRAGHCTHIFKGHGGIISALSFDIHLESNRARLAVGAGDCRIKLWDLTTKDLVGMFEGGHVSVIRGLGITRDGLKLVSGSRDKVLIVWDLADSGLKSNQILKTIPIYESIESIGLIYPSEDQETSQPSKKKSKKSSKSARSDDQLKINQSPLIYTAGEKGLVRLWNLESGAEVDSEANHQDVSHKDLVHVGISDTRFDPVSSTLLVNKTDQTFSLFNLPSLELVQQIVGSHDEIIDIALLRSDSSNDQPSQLAVATNSPLVRILSLGDNENDCRLLAGHSDIVLCLAKSKDQTWFVSGSKDKSARVWKSFHKVESSNSTTGKKLTWRTVASCEGHVQSLGALSIAEFLDSKGKPTTLLATASQDRTVKLWDLSSTVSTTSSEDEDASEGGMTTPTKLKSLLTMQIHDKDINSIDFSADCSLLGSGSQDKLGKLFVMDHSSKMGTSLKLLGILKGHSRGIWSIKFSKHDPVVITGSGDCTIKLWSTDRKLSNSESSEHGLDGFGSCLKTFEGHSNSILRLDFTNFGQQIVSASSDCLLKLWDIKTQVCVATLGDSEEHEDNGFEGPNTTKKMKSISDSHEGKIWALDVVDEAGNQMISGGADSRLIYWKDITGEIEQKKIKLKEREVEINQDLENFIRVKDFSAVIKLLIKLDKPARLLRLFTDLERAGGEEGKDEFGSLDLDQTVTGSLQIDKVIQNLTQSELCALLKHIKSWNSVNRSSTVAQKLLFLIFKSKSFNQLLLSSQSSSPPEDQSDDLLLPQNQSNLKKKTSSSNPHNKNSHLIELKDTLKVLLAYSDRNLNKIDKTVQESFLIEFLLNQFN
ncbi:hypothetical protein PSHT_15845 [Puccinia striiformis]|uniref:U3 small nucleolar RNA-associated protein 13 C-terminal domain-containing protein n=1 Tax=Puccinia striiformis TaxID=27350 RepID=A0A2S4UCU7_9BASI|nr:hypothetical protein PSHT_15845 [Puccinia striiformis]